MSKKECDVEYKIHSLLLKLKKDNGNIYEPTKRILKYLYKTVKEDYFEHHIESEYRKDKEDRIKVMISAEKCLFEYYVNEEEGVLENLIALCNDDRKYFYKFYEGIETFLEMSENNLFSNYGVYKYVFNMYAMLKAYQYHHDFETFSVVVDDLSNFFIESILDLNNSSYSSSMFGLPKREFVHKKELIDIIMSCKGYENRPFLRENLKEVLNNINEPYSEGYLEKYKEILRCYKELIDFQEQNPKLDQKNFESIENDLLKNLEACSKNYRGYNYDRIEFFNYFLPILLQNKRYDFFKNELNTIEENIKYRKDILKQVGTLDIDFFEFLNKELKTENDSFISTIKVVFDSDTYCELQSKLNDLKKASNLYKENPQEALQIIKELTTNKHKEVIDGIMMIWPRTNTVNQIEKPKTILERTIALHKRLEYPLEEKVYHDKANSSYYQNTIKDFVNSIQNEIASNKKKIIDDMKKKEEEAKAQEQTPEPPKKQKGLGSIFSQFKNNN